MRRAGFPAALTLALLTAAACGSAEPAGTTDPTPAAAPITAAPADAPVTATAAPTTAAPPDTTPSATAAPPVSAPSATSAPAATTPASPSPTAAPLPTETATEPVAAPVEQCSSSSYDVGGLRAPEVSAEVEATARVLLDAAASCDSATLIELAKQDGTVLSFGAVPPEEVLALPDVEERYLKLAVVLTRTDPGVVPGDAAGPYVVWPAAAGESATDGDWQDVVDSGLHTQEEIDAMRAFGAYDGWRVGVASDGSWSYYVAGD